MLLLQRDWSLEAELPQVFGGEEGWQSERYICIHVIDGYLTNACSSAWVFDIGSVSTFHLEIGSTD